MRVFGIEQMNTICSLSACLIMHHPPPSSSSPPPSHLPSFDILKMYYTMHMKSHTPDLGETGREFIDIYFGRFLPHLIVLASKELWLASFVE